MLRRATRVLDTLVDEGVTDAEQVVAAGISRGAFIALHFAARDERVGAVAALAPVTDLERLAEFAGARAPAAVRALKLERVAHRLACRSIWIAIGSHDDRVGTEGARVSLHVPSPRAPPPRTRGVGRGP